MNDTYSIAPSVQETNNMIQHTTVERYYLMSELATETRAKGYTYNADNFAYNAYNAYNAQLQLDSEASVIYCIEEFPEITIQ